MARLLDGWFVDRATGRGKPVYSSGTTIVPTNGVVGGGVSSAPTSPTFATASPAIVRAVNLLDGWFCDRAGGNGKIVQAVEGNLVPANGPVAGGVGSSPLPIGVGGKYYFEVTVGLVSVSQVSGAQIGFINATQRDTLPSSLFVDDVFYPASGAPIGGRCIWQGRENVNGATITWSGSPSAWIAGVQSGHIIPNGNWNPGDVIGVAVDTINSLFWMRNWMTTSQVSMTSGWHIGNGPEAGTNGFDFSGMPGNLYIWFGAPGRYTDSATLNAGATQFYGLGGTHVIPAGFVAWDATGKTTWDKSAAVETGMTAFGAAAGQGALRATLEPGHLEAIIHTWNVIDDPQLIGPRYGSTWSSLLAYPAGQNTALVLDGGGPFGIGPFDKAFYITDTAYPGGPQLNQPIGNVSWESAMIGVVSNTAKARV